METFAGFWFSHNHTITNCLSWKYGSSRLYINFNSKPQHMSLTLTWGLCKLTNWSHCWKVCPHIQSVYSWNIQKIELAVKLLLSFQLVQEAFLAPTEAHTYIVRAQFEFHSRHVHTHTYTHAGMFLFNQVWLCCGNKSALQAFYQLLFLFDKLVVSQHLNLTTRVCQSFLS